MLIDIIKKVAPETGFIVTNTDDRAYLVNQINSAWKELYESRDLVHCEREQLFSIDSDLQQVSLPSYVGHIRGAREYTTQRKVPVTDMRPRYKSDGWTQGPLPYWWRDKGVSPLSREISNEAPVTLSIPQAETAEFSVVIVGKNSNSSRVKETVTFAIGDTEKLSVNSYNEINHFGNVAAHTYDVTMTDADDNELSVLPNVALAAMYRIVNILPEYATNSDNPWVVEVLYKHALVFLWDNYDALTCPDYDDAVAWHTIGNMKAKTKPDEAQLAFVKVNKILADMDKNENRGKRTEIGFADNPSLYMSQCGYRGSLAPGFGRR
jgi:hypothetical protein